MSSVEATQPIPSRRIPAPRLPRTPLGACHRQQDPKGKKRSPPKTQPRTRAKLEKVTSQPVTTFYPSERLTHCNRPGLALTRAGGLEHAWTVSALSESLVHEKPRVGGAQATALGNTRMRPQEPPGKRWLRGHLLTPTNSQRLA